MFEITKDSPVFIIAEIGLNHNGNVNLGRHLIDLAKRAGADCAKFQMRSLSDLYVNNGDSNDPKENLGSQYTLDLLNKFKLTLSEMCELFDYCKKAGIMPLCTPWDEHSFNNLQYYGLKAYKIASADLTNHDLIEMVCQTGKQIILSTGMSTEQEIIETVSLLHDNKYVLLSCNSTYPVPSKDINLNYLDRLKEIGNGLVGYSGHDQSIFPAIAAVAKGAKVIEKHLTIDNNMEGNDHKVSLLPQDFKAMVDGIRIVEESLGTDKERSISQGEKLNRATLAKSIIAKCDIDKGTKIDEAMLLIRSPGRGLQPNKKKLLVGTYACRDLKQNDVFYPSDLNHTSIQPRDYKFTRSWGTPVRYHDYIKLWVGSNQDFLEFHLSYKDMNASINEYFDCRHLGVGLVVHSPDTFSGDHLLSLSHPDPAHRKRSSFELQRVATVTQELKPYFDSLRPLIVVSLGGFTTDNFILSTEKIERYEILARELEVIRKANPDVEIVPQTLPPFPWYFGGRMYLNLFVSPVEIQKFCQTYDYRICLDISHAQLACNFYEWKMKDYLELVGPYVAHLHLADASGVDDEGLQIGQGEVDFELVAEYMNRLAPKASFIPEIWQGHENNGEGFWIAADKLEGVF